MRRAWMAAAATLIALGCSNAGESRLLGVSGKGVAKGIIYFDLDGNKIISGGDDSVKNMTVRLVTLNGRDTVASATTLASGEWRAANVPVGTYRVVLDTTPLSDTATVVQQDSLRVTILPDDSSSVVIGVSYPHLSIRQARTPASVPLGRKVFIEGIVLNASFDFRDTTMHIADTSAAIRMTRVIVNSAQAADSVIARGITSTRAGQRTLDQVSIFGVSSSFLPTAVTLTTAAATTADGGTRDAQLVEVLNATIVDTLGAGNRTPDYIFTVNDGSDSLTVVLDATAFSSVSLPGLFIPTNKFDIVGLLVPSGTPGIWRLKPRSLSDTVKR